MSGDVSLLGDDDTSETTSEDTGKETTETTSTDITVKSEKPASLPDEYWDTEKNAVKTDDLLKAYEAEKTKALGLRKKLSTGSQNAPKDIDGYKLEWDDEETPLAEDDNFVSVFKEIAHENKLNQEQFNGLLKSFHKSYKEGKLEKSEEQTQEEIQQWQQEEQKRLGPDHKKITDGYKGWGRQYVQNGVLTEDEYKEFLKIPASAEHMKIMTKIKSAAGFVNDIPTNGVSVDGSKTREEIDALIAHPDYGDETKGAGLRKTVENYFKTLHPS